MEIISLKNEYNTFRETNEEQTEKLIEKWFDKNYPDNLVITAFPIVE